MKRAVKRDAVRKEAFYFRKTIIPGEFKFQTWNYYTIYTIMFLYLGDDDDEIDGAASIPQEYTEMDIDTIMNGKVWLVICNYFWQWNIYHRVVSLG